jgi:hypothetical protein
LKFEPGLEYMGVATKFRINSPFTKIQSTLSRVTKGKGKRKKEKKL